ncbi:MAG: DUF1998 domain-containing protein [Deltaproteobacteria bacterium]|nr:DUF1998 domain-containing protein [Deltaproteobacteria bacterium]
MFKKPTPVGELRPSQLLYTYGIGAIVDLPNISAIVLGLEDWDPMRCTTVVEDRLLSAVRTQLGGQVKRMVSPPVTEDEGVARVFGASEASTVGVPVATFPRYLRCPFCNYLGPITSGVFEPKIDQYRRERTRFVHKNCLKGGRPPTALPARFLVACENGHLDDFPWHRFVHKGESPCRSILELREVGASGEAIDVQVRCRVCDKSRRMGEAFGEAGKTALPPCRGRRPHLRDFEDRPCDAQQRAILLGASNSWFPVTLSALALPVGANKLEKLVDDNWTLLAGVKNVAVLEYLRGEGKLVTLREFSDSDVWRAIEERRSGGASTVDLTDLKTPEWTLLTERGRDAERRDFKVTEVASPPDFAACIDRVLLVERLREVTALVGFTRIVSSGDAPISDESSKARRARLTRNPPEAVPATEVRGEGSFITFKEGRIAAWLERAKGRETVLAEAHRLWRVRRNLTPPEANFPRLRYVLIHTFAHALMRQLALECGYTAASLKERIYAREKDEDGPSMAGLLIYTAAPDSEGTLGGLVSLGQPERLGRHIRNALEAMRLCASDPLCAEHQPFAEEPTLHGAACHACLFAPETSCERGNRYLDRTLLVRTVLPESWAYFEERS